MPFGLMLSLASIVILLLALFIGAKLRPQTRYADTEAAIIVDEKIPFAQDSDKTVLSPDSELPDSVTRSDNNLIERGDWVLRMTHHVFNKRHQCRYNVVVINKELEYHFDPKGIVERLEVKYFERKRLRPIPYEIVVFKEGALINMGDGGDINWDWQGNFVRSGNNMLNFKPCVPGVAYQQDPWVAVA